VLGAPPQPSGTGSHTLPPSIWAFVRNVFAEQMPAQPSACGIVDALRSQRFDFVVLVFVLVVVVLARLRATRSAAR
jgi:hypothetical protein